MNHLFQLGSPSFLLLSLFIISFATYTMFQMQRRKKPDNGQGTFFGIVGSSLVFTLGLWAMHVVILLASDFMLNVQWTLAVNFSSTAFLVSCALWCYHHSKLSKRLAEAAASFLLAVAVTWLHYFSILSHSIQKIDMDVPLAFISFFISFAGSYAAIVLLRRRTQWRYLSGSVAVGLSSLAMHTLGMQALTVEYRHVMTMDRLNDFLMLLAFMLGIMTMLIIAFFYTTWLGMKKITQIDERYRLLVENSTDTIAIIVDGRWEYLNPSGLRLFEAEGEHELMGNCIFSMLHGSNHTEMQAWLQHVPMEGESELGPIELQWRTLKGNLILTEMVRIRTTYDGKPVEQVMIRDISERKRNEQLYVNAEKLSIAGQLAAGVAHEIRNPLTSLKGFVQLIASGRVLGNQYYPIMKAELSRIESTVSELLMLSKPQAYELKRTNLKELLSESSAAIGARAMAQGVRIKHRFGNDPAWVLGVGIQLKQAFINVMKNAVEAMQEGGTLRIELKTDQRGMILVCVTDTGTGIPQDQLAKMGQPFYSTKDKGTGLGLLVTYKIVENHNGHIAIESEMGVGTTLRIAFPSELHEGGGAAAR
ncbi:ATP-binding protein [Paenibacillus sp. LHD-117]|uniref:ATP-binding protein n=1 Tax=Paenibacillus sp. LHD-117 TaxID=3071412 RepID=UPI0027E065C2|nr:ATP-binding protein [Paenibacillus sp. LHD-117]MDQ6421335.1 ATP-binding protein [Paenibacillus sp. LHD-117]